MTDLYDSIRSNRFDLTMDTEIWACHTTRPGGYTHHLVFLIRYEGLLIPISQVQQALVQTGGFVAFESTYFHITLKGGELYNTQEDLLQDAYTYRDKLDNLRDKFTPFQIDFRWVNFFGNVIFIQCFDGGMLKELHQYIISCLQLPVRVQRDMGNYLPHMAIWTYRDTSHTKGLFEMGEKYRQQEFWTCTIQQIELCDVVRSPAMKFPQIETIHVFHL